jgi:hypothetical protein
MRLADLPGVDVEGDQATLGRAVVVVEFHPHLVVAGRDGGFGLDVEVLQPNEVWQYLGLPWCRRYRLQPPNAPPWAMITPLPPPSGTTTWAVMEWDLFFRLMTEFPTEPGHAAGPTPRTPPLTTPSRQRISTAHEWAKRPARDGSTWYSPTETGNPFLEPFGVESWRG